MRTTLLTALLIPTVAAAEGYGSDSQSQCESQYRQQSRQRLQSCSGYRCTPACQPQRSVYVLPFVNGWGHNAGDGHDGFSFPSGDGYMMHFYDW